jgi:hypothetical protein
MTEYTDLIARLRETGLRDDYDAYRAADALEAQARQIAELEERHDECFRIWDNYRIDTNARIAELEAENAKLREALKPFADCGVWDGYKDEEVFKLGFKIADLRAARAAYLGEKND